MFSFVRIENAMSTRRSGHDGARHGREAKVLRKGRGGLLGEPGGSRKLSKKPEFATERSQRQREQGETDPEVPTPP